MKVENTVRWRELEKADGRKRESNARLVHWSDGSMTLHLGSEIFDVYKQPLMGDHNHLFVRQGTGLQGQTIFRTKYTFRPYSTDSSTHRKMTLSLADRSMKTSGVKLLSLVGKDPEAHRGELIKVTYTYNLIFFYKYFLIIERRRKIASYCKTGNPTETSPRKRSQSWVVGWIP